MDAAEEDVPQANCDCGASKSAIDLKVDQWLFRLLSAARLSHVMCHHAATQQCRARRQPWC